MVNGNFTIVWNYLIKYFFPQRQDTPMKGIDTKQVHSGPPATRRNGIEVKTINPPRHHAFEKAMTDLEGGLKHLVCNREPADACSA